ncbi:MAG: ParB N-terminal domain-containing protein [Sphingopyxis terrae]|nr:ParB N-terminal domain-containing protein [Sphingopyxis terrae]
MKTDKAKAPRAKKAETTAETLAPSNIAPVEYGRLRRAPENVRRTNIAADVENLADDIAAHGLLQSLIGYAGDTDIDAQTVYIVGGGRRLQALQLLHERGVIDDHWPVSVLIRDQGEAIELSLSENLARRDMNPADEFEAFAALMSTGATNPAQLGKRFGFTERYVKQRLRLAALHPEILEAVRTDAIGVESAMAYARTDNVELQLKVFKAQSKPNTWNAHSASNVRQAYDQAQMDTDDTIFLFIDAATYEKEGGGYEEDLFGAVDEAASRRLTNPDLARAIATRCAEFQAERLIGEAQADHESIGDFVLPQGLVAGGRIEAPARHVEIREGYNYDLGREISLAELWPKIDEMTDCAVIVIHLARDYVEAEGDDPDASMKAVARLKIDRSRVYVPKAVAEQIVPKCEPPTYVETTPEEREAQQHAREARLWAARLAVPKLSEIAGFEGRVFYDDAWLFENRHRPGDPRSGPYTPSFTVRVFVTEEEIAAHLEAGTARAAEIREEEARRRAEAEAAREAAQTARGEALKAKIAELEALDDEPAVIMVDIDGVDHPLQPLFRQEDGTYVTADTEQGYDSLDFLVECSDIIGDIWPTRDAYETAAGEGIDEEAPEDA